MPPPLWYQPLKSEGHALREGYHSNFCIHKWNHSARTCEWGGSVEMVVFTIRSSLVPTVMHCQVSTPIGSSLNVHLIKHTLLVFTVISSEHITCLWSASEVSSANVRDRVTAFLSMLESPRSANMWFNDPDASPVLSQIFKTYHAERHALQRSGVEQQPVITMQRGTRYRGVAWSSSK